MLKGHENNRLMLNCDTLLSSFAFDFNLRRYILEFTVTSAAVLEEDLDQRTPITATMRFMGADGRAVQVFAYSRR
jgi:hypothetical protein